MDGQRIRDLIDTVQQVNGRTVPAHDEVELRDIGFKSLDFSEVVLRVEEEAGRELNFDAVPLRAVRTVGDVVAVIEAMLRG